MPSPPPRHSFGSSLSSLVACTYLARYSPGVASRGSVLQAAFLFHEKCVPFSSCFLSLCFCCDLGGRGHRSAYEQAMELDPNNRMAAYNLVRKKNERRGIDIALQLGLMLAAKPDAGLKT